MHTVRAAIMLLVLLVAAPPALATRASQATPRALPAYTIAELPTPGGDVTRAFAINDAGQIVGWGRTGGVTRAFVMTRQTPASLDTDPCAGVAAWNAAMEPVMVTFFEALEPTGLLNGDRSLTRDEWQDVAAASLAAVAALDAITPPQAREEWHAAQRRLVATFGAEARSHLAGGKEEAAPSAATWIATIVAMDRAIATARTCPHS